MNRLVGAFVALVEKARLSIEQFVHLFQLMFRSASATASPFVEALNFVSSVSTTRSIAP